MENGGQNSVTVNGYLTSVNNLNGLSNEMNFIKNAENNCVNHECDEHKIFHDRSTSRNGNWSPLPKSSIFPEDNIKENCSGSENPTITNGNHLCELGDVNGTDATSENGNINGNLYHDTNREFYDVDLLESSGAIAETTELTADLLKDLFEDKICVLWVKNYIPELVCNKLDSFLKERASDQYSHEIAKDGKFELQYFGVNRYGFPLNSAYNDDTDSKIEEYLSKALPTIRSIRKAAAPFLSPVDKFRVELDEVWPKKANIASLRGQKTFCGIGRVMPSELSGLSADQPHFDAVPVKFFPDIHKQFTANFYLNVPEEGGELEMWNVRPIDVENLEKFTIPENWRQALPRSFKVKPGQGDLLMFNTRRPHAITKFEGPNPRTSLQTFIGYTTESEVFLWV